MSINGTWRPIGTKLNGVEFDSAMLQEIELTIHNDDFSSVVGGVSDKGKLKVDEAKNPMTMDIVSTEGPNVGKVIPAIYKLNNDTLTICYNLQRGVRPADFTSTSENKYFLVVYKKEK